VKIKGLPDVDLEVSGVITHQDSKTSHSFGIFAWF
jgi:hypothetical protein